MDIRTVLIRWVDEPDGMPFEVDVVVGDGTVIYGEDYEYDERIFFYFQNAEEYKVAFSGGSPKDGIEFEILEQV